jgi:F0F1-type ATP synthase assembly protein I
MPCVLTTGMIIVFLRRNGMWRIRYLVREIWAVLVFYLLLPLYVDLTYVALDFLVGGSLAEISNTLFILLVTPFVFLFFTIFIPQSRTGKALRRLLRSKKVRHESPRLIENR